MNLSCYLLSHLHYWFKIVQLNCTRLYKNCNLMMAVLLTICLFLYRKNLKKTRGCVWGMTTRVIKLMKFYTRSKIEGWQCNCLHHKNLEENQGWYLENDNTNNEINESLCLTPFVYVCFYRKGFYHCNQDHHGMHMICWYNNIISMLHNLL